MLLNITQPRSGFLIMALEIFFFLLKSDNYHMMIMEIIRFSRSLKCINSIDLKNFVLYLYQTCLKLKRESVKSLYRFIYIYNIHSIYNFIDVIGIYGEGKGNPLQYSCLENPIDKGAWQAIFHGVARV